MKHQRLSRLTPRFGCSTYSRRVAQIGAGIKICNYAQEEPASKGRHASVSVPSALYLYIVAISA